MKKGFTLIELLATIIVFTIVAMIGYNIVLTVIEKAREQAFARSVEFAMNSFDFARQYDKPDLETIEIKSSDLKLEHNRFIGGDIILDDNGNAKVLYATDGNYCANGLLGNLIVTKGNCNQDLVSPTVTIEAIPSIDKSELTIRLNATDSGLGLDPKAYSFDNGTTWQESNEISVSSSYKNIIKVRDIVNNITTIDYNISKLTINANGGVITGLDEVSIYWLEDLSTMTIPTPIKVGYSFSSWTKVGDSSISGNAFTMGTEETCLTANYINATFTLQVNPNGGTWDSYTTTQSYSKIYGSTTTINNPTRTGYTFTGWSVSGTNSSISGTTFTMGSTNSSLTANWTINTYTLTVNANGGSWSGTTPQTLVTGATSAIVNPTRSGYVFTGWSIIGSGSSMSGTTFTMGTASTTLTANWVAFANMFTYTGSFNIIDDGNSNWRIKFLSSGVFTPLVNMSIDVFLVGGGGGGSSYSPGDNGLGGGGGGSGYTTTAKAIWLPATAQYGITVGGGGVCGEEVEYSRGGTGGPSQAFGYSASGGLGGYMKYGGAGGSGGGNGDYWNSTSGVGSDGSGGEAVNSGAGQGTTTREFGEAWGTLYAGGGGGGTGCQYCTSTPGGAGGGGNGGFWNVWAGEPVQNTGSGGGGIGGGPWGMGTNGANGIVVIRNHR